MIHFIYWYTKSLLSFLLYQNHCNFVFIESPLLHESSSLCYHHHHFVSLGDWILIFIIRRKSSHHHTVTTSFIKHPRLLWGTLVDQRRRGDMRGFSFIKREEEGKVERKSFEGEKMWYICNYKTSCYHIQKQNLQLCCSSHLKNHGSICKIQVIIITCNIIYS